MTANNKRNTGTLARSALAKWTSQFASASWIPSPHCAIPIGDLAMIMQVDNVYQIDVDASRAGRFFTVIAALLVGSKIAHSVLTLLPEIGWADRSVIALVITKAAGLARIHYSNDCLLPLN